MEKISFLMSDILDYIGYSEEIISIRRKYWQHYKCLLNTDIPEFTLVIAGSKAEGITSPYESDIDLMYLFNDTICSDDIQHLFPVSDFTTLHADTTETPPGYTRLKMISCHGDWSRTYLKESSFESESSDVYISSSIFAPSFVREPISEYYSLLLQNEEISGPSVPRLCFGYVSYDIVAAFPCYCPKILQTWKRRRRLYSWPPVDVREAAASMLAQVVPVGNKKSDDQWREWRFCFILSELELTFSLNETQIKLYILLKMVAKDILKNVNKEISSYIMKNITFWLSEILPEEMFIKDKLMSLLFLSLMYLKLYISESNWLPYYMIPGRNLLAERLSPESNQQMCDLIDMLIAEGPRFIFMRCNKPRAALEFLFSSPISLVDYGTRRDMIEKQFYFLLRQVGPFMLENLYYVSAMTNTCIAFLIPELETLINNGMPLIDIMRLYRKRLPLSLKSFISLLS